MDVIQISDLSVRKETATEDVLEILKLIRPSWSKEDIIVESLTGGYSSLMFKCFNKNDINDAITFRARNKLSDLPMADHDLENQVLKRMSDLEYFPKVLATFKNGYCYTYIKGAPIYKMSEPPLRISETQLRCIARGLAAIHNVKIDNVDYSKTNFIKSLYKLLDNSYPKLTEGLPTCEELKREVGFVDETISNKDYVIGICHGDPHPGNIVWNDEDESATFVDWEITHIGYQLNDLAYFLFFAELKDTAFPFVREIPDDLKRKFLRHYLEKVAEYDNSLSPDITNDQINKMEDDIHIFKLLVSLYLVILFGCLFLGPASEINEKALKYMKTTFTYYLDKKKFLFPS